MTLAGNTLDGTTTAGGAGQQGTVFKLNTDGSAFSVLYSFSYATGAQPDPLILSGNDLYGMMAYGIQAILWVMEAYLNWSFDLRSALLQSLARWCPPGMIQPILFSVPPPSTAFMPRLAVLPALTPTA